MGQLQLVIWGALGKLEHLHRTNAKHSYHTITHHQGVLDLEDQIKSRKAKTEEGRFCLD